MFSADSNIAYPNPYLLCNDGIMKYIPSMRLALCHCESHSFISIIYTILKYSCCSPTESRVSKLFSGFPPDLLTALASEALTENSHRLSLATEVGVDS